MYVVCIERYTHTFTYIKAIRAHAHIHTHTRMYGMSKHDIKQQHFV